jgi:PIN domain-containing protein
MLHVFIDSNIYLRFFAYADDTLEELEKFQALAETDKVTIYLPEQVQDEVSRNREGEIARAVARFQKSALPPEIPRFALHTDEAKALLKESKKAADAKASLSQKITEEIQKGDLRADQLIDQLAEHSTVVETTDDHVAHATFRRDVGNPPGKPETLGDQINWECLLDAVPENTDLHIVSTDEDFSPSWITLDLPSSWLTSGNGRTAANSRSIAV